MDRLRVPACRLTVGTLCLLITTAVAAQPARVTVAPVERQQWVENLPLTGTLTSLRDASLTPRVSGLVDSVSVDAGDRVEAGDTLIELDRTLNELTLDQMRAELEAARGQQAEAERVLKERRPLAEDGVIPSTELEAARAEAQIRNAEVARLDASIREQRERLQRHTVVAPFAGVVRSREAEVGEWVDNQTPVVDLVATQRLRLDVRAPQEYYPLLKRGTAVQVHPDAWPERSIEAEITTRVAVSDPRSRTFLVRIELDNADGKLAPGMSAQARFLVRTEEEVLVVPRDATLRAPDGGIRVWVVREADGETRVAERQVKAGRSDDGRVEIREGLERGDRVVVRGNESLSAGDTVTPVPADDD